MTGADGLTAADGLDGLAGALQSLDTRLLLAGYLLVLDIWAIVLIARARPGWREGLLWSAIVLFVPIFGCLFWYALGPKALRRPPPPAAG
ncbi:MAG: PLD nuclease N-terminal domain-containing protein [Gemmatimonadota bacterium]|nr:PLD nuclease N-terminal domain-containing protein [Gemmatimonadota bacterium]